MEIKIERFASEMQQQLYNNSHKGSIFDWKGIYEKISDFEYHKAKMLVAMRTGNKGAVKEYIADCANILLSIGDEAGLYDNDSENLGKAYELKEELFNEVSVFNSKKVTNFTDKILN